jgi:glutathione S-transferase
MAGDGSSARLLQLPYSPWSEKARWALDFHEIPCEMQRYEPLIGEPKLRWSLRRLSGPVSVPCLHADGRWIDDSFAIARWADAHSHRADRARLIPDADHDRIERYNALSERGLAGGRWRSLRRMLDSPAALRDMVPRNLRRLGPVAVGIASLGVRRTLHKYAGVLPEHEAQRSLVEALDQLRSNLQTGGTTNGVEHLLEHFSHADIAMAQVLAFVDPPSTHLRMSKGTRSSFHDPELAPRYADLLAWRDALYEQFRGPESVDRGPAARRHG